METNTYPRSSIPTKVCLRCKSDKIESGGYRKRRHRDVGGIRIEKVLRLRWSNCKRSVGCIYPEGVLRHKWYSLKVHGVFAILDVHQVDEACANELAAWLGYPIKPATRAAWQSTEVWRTQQYEAKDKHKPAKLIVASLDECKLGEGWMYTLTDVPSQALVAYEPSSERTEIAVRALLSEHTPKVVISDGCARIEAALAYLPEIEQGRCWFHVIKDVLQNFPRDSRERVGWDLEFLYRSDTLEDAERFLNLLKDKYGVESLVPLERAWPQLKNYWLVDGLPLTNNASEILYNALWPRQRKRVIKTLERTLDWFKQARWRWNHHFVPGLSPWQRFTGKISPHWLRALVTPLRRSTDFSR
jgi:hypothetical protein